MLKTSPLLSENRFNKKKRNGRYITKVHDFIYYQSTKQWIGNLSVSTWDKSEGELKIADPEVQWQYHK